MDKKLTVTQAKNSPRNDYGELTIFEDAIKSAYPEIGLTYHSPGCWGANPDIWLEEWGGKIYLSVPHGRYTSNKHRHTAGHGILAIEDARDCKLNLRKCPLFLLTGRAFNGDYRSLTKTYFLFGRNEDNSFFLHKIRPSVGETGDLDACRNWMWQVKTGEKIVARQGDLGFIARKSRKPSGKTIESKIVQIGNHKVVAEVVKATPSGRYFVLNGVAEHHEHHTVIVPGWTELRLARAWSSSSAD